MTSEERKEDIKRKARKITKKQIRKTAEAIRKSRLEMEARRRIRPELMCRAVRTKPAGGD